MQLLDNHKDSAEEAANRGDKSIPMHSSTASRNYVAKTLIL